MTHNFLIMCLFIFLTLYLFRAHRGHHQKRKFVSIQPPVAVTLCRWPCRVQVGSETSDLQTTRPPTQSDSYRRLYWHNLSLLMMSTMCSKNVELIIIIIINNNNNNNNKDTYIEKIVRYVCYLPSIIRLSGLKLATVTVNISLLDRMLRNLLESD